MRCACVDVGSNTTAMLVADLGVNGLTKVASERYFTLLGATPTGEPIPEHKIVETEVAVRSLVERARELNAESIDLIATHIVREAANGTEICARIEAAVGLPLRMIDGHTEARYSCAGALGGLDRVRATTVVIDAGGGSTEISICRPDHDPETASFGIGSARLHAEYLTDDPPSAQQIADARAHADAVFSSFEVPADLTHALAVGGGATTAQKLMGGVIDGDGIDRVLAMCKESASAELAGSLGLEAARAALLPSSLVVLGALTSLLGVTLEVGRGGMREGVLLSRTKLPPTKRQDD